MENSPLASDSLPDFRKIFDDFLNDLEEYSKKAVDMKYLQALAKNTSALKKIYSPKVRVNELPDLFVKMYSPAKERYNTSMGTSTKSDDRKRPFGDVGEKYLRAFSCLQIARYDYLNSYAENADPGKKLSFTDVQSEREYYDKFLKVSTFLTAHYGLVIQWDEKSQYFWISNEQGVEVENQEDEIRRYYLFYNRSQPVKGIGIGDMEITHRTCRIRYFYSDADVVIKGVVRDYNDHSVTVFKEFKDEKNETEFLTEPQRVEGFYFLKKHQNIEEPVVLGIYCSSNRDKFFPSATAIVMVEKRYYDLLYPQDSIHGFGKLKERKKKEDDDNGFDDRETPPSIFYFLKHQSLSLEYIIETAKDKSLGVTRPFKSLESIVLNKNFTELLEYVAGNYTGLSVIPMDQSDKLIISELLINPNGTVKLNTLEGEEMSPLESNVGIIKEIRFDSNSELGEIFIDLRFSFERRYHSLNFYLEFNQFKNSDEALKNVPLRLKGAFAGKSIIAKKVIAATAVFEKVTIEDKKIRVSRTTLTEENNAVISKLYNDHKDLFNFYLEQNNEKYTNNRSISKLREIITFINANSPENNKFRSKFDIFISIPLTSPNNPAQYENNSKLAYELREEIVSNYGIAKSHIFCACLQESTPYGYKHYKEKINASSKAFKEVYNNVRGCKVLIFIYPHLLSDASYFISSAFVEVGLAIGLGKKVLILYDEAEEPHLPRNLIELFKDQCFKFNPSEQNPLGILFEDSNIKDQIRNIILD